MEATKPNTADDVEVGEKTTSNSTLPATTVKEAREALAHDKTIVRSVGRIIFSLVYFAFFASVLFSHIPTARLYEQAYAVSSILATSGGDAITEKSPIKFFNIGQVSDVFDWLNTAFVPAVFVTQDVNGDDLSSEDYARFGGTNKALAGVIFEVISMPAVECDTSESLLQLYPVCHVYDELPSEHNWYLLRFNLNATEALQKLSQWKAENWIDNSTYRLVISVLTYNGEIDGYVVIELELHFHPGGYITPIALTRPTISIPYGRQSAYARDVLVWVWMFISLMWAGSSVAKW